MAVVFKLSVHADEGSSTGRERPAIDHNLKEDGPLVPVGHLYDTASAAGTLGQPHYVRFGKPSLPAT